MQADISNQNSEQLELQEIEAEESVCKTVEEEYRLTRLFEILIEIDKSLKKKSNENNQRNTNNTSQT